MSKKHAFDSFFTPKSQKRARVAAVEAEEGARDDFRSEPSTHATYPFPVSQLPQSIVTELATVPATLGKTISDQPDLDLLYFQPFIPGTIERELFLFLRRSLFFYRVQYMIKRGGYETQINTPRFTTVFGVDTSSVFAHTADGNVFLAESANRSKPIPKDRYKTCTPRPIPGCLDHLRRLTEAFTGAEYNFCLVNYYASGADSISYHSDDEHFLGAKPCIASFSLGATRDFLMKHKQHSQAALKLPLASGDMIVMRGETQANWMHSIPKRKGKGIEGGRINITFRKGVKMYCTENYYQYNVGDGPAYKWDGETKEMREWRHGTNEEAAANVAQ